MFRPHIPINLGAAVHNTIVYKPLTTNNTTTAQEVFRQKCGVCQDLSHVLITCLRIFGIAARYVSGYVKGLKLSHAWVEAFYDGCWHTFDATENFFVTSGYIKVAHGRDAAGCPLNFITFPKISPIFPNDRNGLNLCNL
ncbi:MAG: transglutaminase family protein [Bacteroidales bacterium]|nr:transglutaminase family protein [Bacteroidales bacterium]